MADYHNYNTTLASNILEAIPKLIQKYEDNPDITLSELLQKTDTETLENVISECLTEENDYDDFHEHHTSLATIFHERLKSEELWNVYVFPYYDSTADKYFKTKKECKKFRDRIIKKYYNKAEEYITPGNSKALSVSAADRYSRTIKDTFSPYIKTLEMIGHQEGADEAFNIIKSTTAIRTFIRILTRN